MPTIWSQLRPMTQRPIQSWMRRLAPLSVALTVGFAASAAHAVDGCKALLCLAGNWSAIPACVPTVLQLFDELLHFRPFPTCDMSGSGGNAGSFQWASAPGNCPPQYTTVNELESETRYSCNWTGVINIQVDGMPWVNVWWSMGGASVTDYSAAARTKLGPLADTRFDDDYARWLASRPAPPTCQPGDC